MLQESGRHTEALDAVTSYLDLGVYSEWDEEKKLDFLTRELKGKRPLVPPYIEVSACLCKATFSNPIDEVLFKCSHFLLDIFLLIT